MAHKPEMAQPPALTWGPYVLGRRIGRGGMGVVHAAVQRGIGGIARLAAVKIMLADRAEPRGRARRRSCVKRASSRSSITPNVVRWLDAGEVEGDVYIAMSCSTARRSRR